MYTAWIHWTKGWIMSQVEQSRMAQNFFMQLRMTCNLKHELFIFGIFHLKILNCSWLQVTAESKTRDKLGWGLLYWDGGTSTIFLFVLHSLPFPLLISYITLFFWVEFIYLFIYLVVKRLNSILIFFCVCSLTIIFVVTMEVTFSILKL